MKFFGVLSVLVATTLTVTFAAPPEDTIMHQLSHPIKMKAHLEGKDLVDADISKITAQKIKKYTRSSLRRWRHCRGIRCKNMNLVSFLTGEELGSPYASVEDPLVYSTWVSDIWGWVDPETGKEYAIVGMWDGTSIVDLSKPTNPFVVGFIPSTRQLDENGEEVGDGLDGFNGIWRDIKVVNDVAYIGAEISFHGIQVFDLRRLRDFGPQKRGIFKSVPTLEADYVARELGSTHNIVAAPEAQKVMGVGMGSDDPTCPAGSLAIYNVSGENRVQPNFEACYTEDPRISAAGYVHDAHCVKYDGPDTRYTGVNVCALFEEDTIVLFNLDTLTPINSFTYSSATYVHQGWFSEDHSTLYADDELDELALATGTDFSTCYIFDVTDLEAEILPPVEFLTPRSEHPSIDHNLYVKDGYIYQAAYTSGARGRKILDSNTIEEVAFFDGEGTCECVAEPGCVCDFFAGTWTYYPYFDSGITIAGGVAEGLFILRPILD